MNGVMIRVCDLRVGSVFVVPDLRGIYKLLAKSSGSARVERRQKRREIDYGVMPYREVEVERIERTNISPYTIIEWRGEREQRRLTS